MNDFAHLLDRLAYEPRRNAKLRMLQDFFARTPDPERGYALGAMTGTLSFREAKPALIRGLVEERIDPVLFRLSHNYVGDLAETTALIWPAPRDLPSPSAGSGLHPAPDEARVPSPVRERDRVRDATSPDKPGPSPQPSPARERGRVALDHRPRPKTCGRRPASARVPGWIVPEAPRRLSQCRTGRLTPSQDEGDAGGGALG